MADISSLVVFFCGDAFDSFRSGEGKRFSLSSNVTVALILNTSSEGSGYELKSGPLHARVFAIAFAFRFLAAFSHLYNRLFVSP